MAKFKTWGKRHAHMKAKRALLDSLGKPAKIIYDNIASEFEIQAELYCGLTALGLDVRGEVRTDDDRHRFDLVVFRDRIAIAIIEVKKRKAGRIGRQINAYEKYGIEVITILGLSEARDFVRSPSRFLFENSPQNGQAELVHTEGLATAGNKVDCDRNGFSSSVPDHHPLRSERAPNWAGLYANVARQVRVPALDAQSAKAS